MTSCADTVPANIISAKQMFFNFILLRRKHTILFFVLKEKTDISIAAALAAALTAAGLDIFVIYRGGALATLLEILSYILLVPLLIFALLAYVFHLSTALSLGIAIGAPLIIVILLAVLAERE